MSSPIDPALGAPRTNAPPRRVSNKVLHLDLTGAIFLWREEAPVLTQLQRGGDLYLPLFSLKSNLDRFLKDYPIPYDRIKQVSDGPEFLSSIPPGIKVMLDPHKHENGRMRFREVFRPGQPVPPPLVGPEGA